MSKPDEVATAEAVYEALVQNVLSALTLDPKDALVTIPEDKCPGKLKLSCRIMGTVTYSAFMSKVNAEGNGLLFDPKSQAYCLLMLVCDESGRAVFTEKHLSMLASDKSRGDMMQTLVQACYDLNNFFPNSVKAKVAAKNSN